MSNFMIPFMIVFVWQSATKTSQPNKSNLIQFMVMVMYAFLLLLWGLWLLRNNKLYNKHRLRDTLNVKYLGKFVYYMVGFTTKEIILVKITRIIGIKIYVSYLYKIYVLQLSIFQGILFENYTWKPIVNNCHDDHSKDEARDNRRSNFSNCCWAAIKL